MTSRSCSGLRERSATGHAKRLGVGSPHPLPANSVHHRQRETDPITGVFPGAAAMGQDSHQRGGPTAREQESSCQTQRNRNSSTSS